MTAQGDTARTRHGLAATTGDLNGAPTGRDRLAALHDRLVVAVDELTSAEGWRQMLRTAAALPTYSPHNILLIASQRPDATAVAGFTTWKKLDRMVRRGEKGIAILAPVLRPGSSARPTAGDGTTPTPAPAPTGDAAARPAPTAQVTEDGASGPWRQPAGFRVVHVFDVSQTDGPDLPSPPRPALLEGQAPEGLLEGLSAQIRAQGFTLHRSDVDLAHPGMSGANGLTDYTTMTVVVRPDLSAAQTVKTLAHELGHVLLHAPGARPAGLTREQAEVEAESVAWIVTAAHGLDASSYTVPYVAGWAAAEVGLVQRTAERVLTTARTVLTHTPAPSASQPSAEAAGLLRTRNLPAMPQHHRTRQPAPVRPLVAAPERPLTDGPTRRATRDRDVPERRARGTLTPPPPRPLRPGAQPRGMQDGLR